MVQRGRKPKPTAMKVLEGNPGKRQLNSKEPKPVKKAPRCPNWLEDEAKKEWKRMVTVRTFRNAYRDRYGCIFWVLSVLCKVERS